MKIMETLKPKTYVMKYGQATVTLELWYLHLGKASNNTQSCCFELVLVINRAGLLCPGKQKPTVDRAKSHNPHRSRITIHSQPLFFWAVLFRNSLWDIAHVFYGLFFFLFLFWKCKHTFEPITVLPLLCCLPFLLDKLWVSMRIWSSWRRRWHLCHLEMVDI